MEISIIMPVYNCEEYLQETIESIKKQTYINWELIAVDDASTDNSFQKIKENSKEIKNPVTIIHLDKNHGVAYARNIALEKATGKYIAFIDADDFWENNKLEEQIGFMKKNNYDFTFTSFSYWKNGKIKKVRKIPKKLTYKESLKNTIILTSTVMINQTKIPKELIKMPDLRRGQDTATWWRILKNNTTAYGLDKRLSIYRRRKNTLSNPKGIALKRTWYLYRKIEKKNVLQASYYFCFYLCNAIKKRIL